MEDYILENARQYLIKKHGSCYGDHEKIKQDFLWLTKNQFFFDGENKNIYVSNKNKKNFNSGGWPYTARRDRFIQTFSLLRHILHNPFDYSSSDVVHSFVSKAKAFVHAGLEDFGITLVESQACGTPVIAYGSGGASETVIDRRTGILFKEQTTEAILEAIKRFNETKFDYSKLRENAERYSVENFEKKLHTYIENKTKEWQEKNKDAFQDT